MKLYIDISMYSGKFTANKEKKVAKLDNSESFE